MKLSNLLTFSLIFSFLFVAGVSITTAHPLVDDPENPGQKIMNPNHESLHVSVEVTTNPAGEDVRVFGSISEVVGPNDWLPTEETEPKARQDDHRLIMMIDVAGLEEVDISIDYLIHGVRYDEYTGYKQSGELTSDAAKTAALDKSGGTSTDNLNNFKIYALIIGHPHSPPEDSDADDQSSGRAQSNLDSPDEDPPPSTNSGGPSAQGGPNPDEDPPPSANSGGPSAQGGPDQNQDPPSQSSGPSGQSGPDLNQNPSSQPRSTQSQPSVNEPQDETQVTYKQGQVFFSEIMNASRGGLRSLAQWIELFNNSTTQAVNLKGWQLQIEARDATGSHRHATLTLEDLPIPPNETSLIVTWVGQRKSDGFTDANANVYNFFNHHSGDFEQNEHRNMVVGAVGFFLKLSDPTGVVVDTAGNLDGDRTTEDLPAWELPTNVTENGARISLMRRYDTAENIPLDGTDADNWVSSSELTLSVASYWGNTTDIGDPGYRNTEKSLPVALSHFRAESSDSGVIVNWTTESELDNAGFNIYRSSSTEGPFVKVNTNLIHGAGTTSQRKAYTWTDTTATPNVAYYYQIEDVSFSGVRQLLATQRLQGVISAKNRLITHWGQLKAKE